MAAEGIDPQRRTAGAMSQTVTGHAGNPSVHNHSIPTSPQRQHAHPLHGNHLSRRIQNVVSQIHTRPEDKGRLDPIAQTQRETLPPDAGMPPVSGVEAPQQRHATRYPESEAIRSIHETALDAAAYATSG